MTRDHDDDPYDLPLGANPRPREEPRDGQSPGADRSGYAGGPFEWGGGEDEGPRAPEDDFSGESPPVAYADAPPRRRRTGLWIALGVVLLLVLLGSAAVVGYLLPRSGPSVVRAAPALVDFGAVTVGEAAAAREVTVENAGEQPLAIDEAVLGGPDAAAFEISADGCSDTRLAPGRSCVVVVRFRPAAAGGARATLEVPAEARNGPAIVTLLGDGAASEPVLDRRRVGFPAVAAGSASRPEEVVLGNRGRAPLPVEGVVIQDDGGGDFRIESDDCSGEVLGAGEECTVRVVFSPAEEEEGERSAVLRFRLRDDERVGPGPAVGLVGVAVAVRRGTEDTDPDTDAEEPPPAPATPAPRPAPSPGPPPVPVPSPAPPPPPPPPPPPAELGSEPEAVDFGELAVGAEGGPETVTLRNTGGTPAPIASLALAGPDAGAFALRDDGCTGRFLTPGGSCTVTVFFRPRQEGVQRARLEVRSPDLPGTAPAVALSGAGAAARLSITPATVAFGEVRLESAVEREIVLSNRGRAPLEIREVAVRASPSQDAVREFAVVANGCAPTAPLGPGERCEVTVRFRPAREGAREAVLVVRHRGAGGEGEAALRGTGTPVPAPRAAVDPPAVRFGTVPAGGRSEIVTVTLANRGTARMEVGAVRLDGADAGEFQTVAGSCEGASFLAAGSECTVGVRFAPAGTGTGARRARLVLPHGAPGGREVVELSGTSGS